ncbi:hypothetical protein QFC22_000461 [Naganishia vaughanmartiniae]|uniref:Uncharacterized protein n=1 Tax=Naganishia vaughanmartiniae TaxID=1424756 RepID=A0ACC2XN54_9TREE|nr:hypothetical protein QFC22_000461 [Naganishia vaughanmartiniae]
MALMEEKFADKKDKKRRVVSTGSAVDITGLKRHPLKNQAFVPLGQSTGSGSSIGGAKMGKGSYIIMAALPDATGQSDLSTLRMDFACFESFDAKTDKVDTDFYRAGKATASTAFASRRSVLPALSNPASSSGSIACASLTTEAFAECGHVVQGCDSAETALAYARVAASSEFRDIKCMDLAPVDETDPAEAGATTGISVLRCTPKDRMQKGMPWSVKSMERYEPRQSILSMYLKGKGEELLPESSAYIVIVAKTGDQRADDRPDPSTLKAFHCNANQYTILVEYGAQISHKGYPRDCALLEFEQGLGVVHIPAF